jgi:aspartyl-tRNA(Asn)/glutamyl-tRNA(Gln) amidotransferase subunit A
MTGRAAPVNAPTTDLTELSLAEVSRLIASRKASPVEVTQACLDRIAKLDPLLNSFISTFAEQALSDARRGEEAIQSGRSRGPLHGVPVAVKDLFDIAGTPTTAGSAVFKNHAAERDAEVIRRLKAAGAVVLGKLNMHECAYGGSSVISHFGPVRNPWATDYSTGGSSGGSAAAVAAGLCYGALGSDTGGSIRQPAAYCGIVGLKPTLGRISTHGVFPLSWTFDHVGPMTRTVEDTVLMLQVLAGYDAADPVSVDIGVPDYQKALGADTSSIRVGIPRKHFYDELHPDVAAAMTTALNVLKKITGKHRDIDIPYSVDARVLRAEAWVYHQPYITKSAELYHPDTLKRIRGGAEVTMETYVRERVEVDKLRRAVLATFDTVDVVVTPTAPVPPFSISELLSDIDGLRRKELVTLQNTRPFNIVGLPTISVPCGFTKTGLPIGLQITGRPWSEVTVLSVAHGYEKLTEWHKHRPQLA